MQVHVWVQVELFLLIFFLPACLRSFLCRVPGPSSFMTDYRASVFKSL